MTAQITTDLNYRCQEKIQTVIVDTLELVSCSMDKVGCFQSSLSIIVDTTKNAALMTTELLEVSLRGLPTEDEAKVEFGLLFARRQLKNKRSTIEQLVTLTLADMGRLR